MKVIILISGLLLVFALSSWAYQENFDDGKADDGLSLPGHGKLTIRNIIRPSLMALISFHFMQ